MHEHLKRRTFAIISHPDAGKTTLTEKLLLFGGAIQMAGAVKGRKASRHATSDWMRLEQERGISVTSSVMQFPYGGALINLLDTPGHEDFSEDTYRTLTAVDSALMVIDAAKGVEARTIKLMEVCRLRTTPIISFINKLDRDGRPPIELLDDIETVLDIECVPMTWPIGMGREFRGIYHLGDDCAYLYQNRDGSRLPDVKRLPGLDSTELAAALGDAGVAALRDEVELVRGATPPFDRDVYLAGRQTPVFFGAAIHNYGVKELLDAFVEHAPPPQPRETNVRVVAPDEDPFSGFVFKIQANMDPAHRDRIAFVRVCSGAYQPEHAPLPHAPRTRGARRRRDHLHGRRPAARRRGVRWRHHRAAQSRHDQHRRQLHAGRAAHVHRHPELRARAVPPRGAQGSAEAQSAAEGPRAALRGGGHAAVQTAPQQRLAARRSRSAAIRGGVVPLARRV